MIRAALGAIAGGTAVAMASSAVVFARKATANGGPRTDKLQIISWSGTSVELAATPGTQAPGVYSLYTGQGSGHARIGRILTSSAASVVREVEEVYRPAPHGVSRGYWSGYAYETPADAGLGFVDVEIRGPRGSVPAWMIPGDDSAVWTVHVHGLGGRRAACIRSAPVFHTLGHTQLVVSYSGDRDAPSLEDGRHHFGLDEWTDVEAALAFAVENGAESVVLSAWSMGATIALQLLEHSVYRDRIAGVVLIAPVLDWRATLAHHGRAAGMPAFVARMGCALIGSRLSRLAGISTPLDLAATSWLATRVELPPVLILHSPSDPMAPFPLSQRLAARSGVELCPMDSPGHTLEWSSHLEACERAVTGWAKRLPVKQD